MSEGTVNSMLEGPDPVSARNDAKREYAGAAAPLLAELEAAGFHIETIGDLYRSKMNYHTAIPILLRWLPRIEDRFVKDDIIRALTVKWAKPVAASTLIDLFRQEDDPSGTGSKWVIANALSVVSDETVLDTIIELVTDSRHGAARQMLALALSNMKQPKAIDTLIELLSDDVVAGHAIIALGKLQAMKARTFIEPFLNHPKAWVRQEARRTLKSLNTQDISSEQRGA